MRGYREIIVCGPPKRVLNWALSMLSAKAPHRFLSGCEFVLRNSGKTDLECVATFGVSDEADEQRAKLRGQAEDKGILHEDDCDGLNTDGWVSEDITGRQP